MAAWEDVKPIASAVAAIFSGIAAVFAWINKRGAVEAERRTRYLLDALRERQTFSDAVAHCRGGEAHLRAGNFAASGASLREALLLVSRLSQASASKGQLSPVEWGRVEKVLRDSVSTLAAVSGAMVEREGAEMSSLSTALSQVMTQLEKASARMLNRIEVGHARS